MSPTNHLTPTFISASSEDRLLSLHHEVRSEMVHHSRNEHRVEVTNYTKRLNGTQMKTP